MAGGYRSRVASLGWCHLGRLDYDVACTIQGDLAGARRAGRLGDVVLTLEHPPVITLGRNAPEMPPSPIRDRADGAAGDSDERPRTIRTGRGGGATYHGPGQLVIYPVLALGRRGRGVRDRVSALGKSCVEVASQRGVAARTRCAYPGAWVGGDEAPRKLASVGIAVRRGVSLHGAALNVERRSEEGFVGFAPCGLAGISVTSLERESGGAESDLEGIGREVAVVLARRLRFADGMVAIPECDLLHLAGEHRPPHPGSRAVGS